MADVSETEKLSIVQVIDLYKFYYQTTEHNSKSRMQTNLFFWTINTGVIISIGYIVKSEMPSSLFDIFFFFVIILLMSGVGISYLWLRLLHIHTKNSKIKFTVLKQIEEKYFANKVLNLEYLPKQEKLPNPGIKFDFFTFFTAERMIFDVETENFYSKKRLNYWESCVPFMFSIIYGGSLAGIFGYYLQSWSIALIVIVSTIFWGKYLWKIFNKKRS